MMSPVEINRVGYSALVEALGFDGMVRFLRQFDQGSGNYTLDRRQWLDNLSLDEILDEMARHEQERSTEHEQEHTTNKG